MLKHGILGLLNYSEMNGYEILETFKDSLAHFWNVQKSQIYRELTSLENEGLITGEWVEQSGKPDKKVFSITDKGRCDLLEWLAEDIKITNRDPILMKTFFLGERNIEENIAFFEKLNHSYSLKYEAFTVADSSNDQYSEELSDSYRSMFWGFTISYGRRRARMIIDWCDECIESLKGVKHE